MLDDKRTEAEVTAATVEIQRLGHILEGPTTVMPHRIGRKHWRHWQGGPPGRRRRPLLPPQCRHRTRMVARGHAGLLMHPPHPCRRPRRRNSVRALRRPASRGSTKGSAFARRPPACNTHVRTPTATNTSKHPFWSGHSSSTSAAGNCPPPNDHERPTRRNRAAG